MSEVFLEKIWEYIDTVKAEKTEEIEKPPCCDKKYTVDMDGYSVCVSCGVVDESALYDDDPFGFNKGNNNTYLHSQPSTLYPKSSLGTVISGNSRMAKVHSWTKMPYSERVIWEVSQELNSKLDGHISQRIITDSIHFYKDVYDKLKARRGKNKKGIIGACVYFCCINNHSFKSVSKLAQLLDLDTKTLNVAIKDLSQLTNAKTHNVFGITDGKSTVSSSDMVSSVCDTIGIDFNIRKKVSKICSFLDKDALLDGVLPQNICASTILFVCRELNASLDKKKLSKTLNTSTQTTERIYNIIRENKQYIFSRLI
jgi:transcription initiation factor TFIIIB Brf1 subunit/transcription initiation factor TFIIB